jgi:Zn-dependent protease
MAKPYHQATVCAQTAIDGSGTPPPPGAPRRRQNQITPLQWGGLAVLIALFLYQAGLLRSPGSIQSEFPKWIALVLAISFHEFSHGFVATLFGDDVPRRAGRLTLNPLKHLDPIGTLMILVGPIGWGKPMPINPAGMRNPNLGWALSSAAGPISNVLLATLTLLVFRALAPLLNASIVPYFQAVFAWNVGLAVFNLVPLPPLDGFGFLYGLAPQPVKFIFSPLWRYGPMILLALLFLPAVLPGFPSILSDAVGNAQQALSSFLLRGVLSGV